MTDEARCPKCGAEIDDKPYHTGTAVYYKCGGSAFSQPSACRIRQLEQQLARVMKERREAVALLRRVYERYLFDEDGNSIEHKDACYCTNTGAGEWIEGKLVGDILACLPCKLRDFLARLDKEPE